MKTLLWSILTWLDTRMNSLEPELSCNGYVRCPTIRRSRLLPHIFVKPLDGIASSMTSLRPTIHGIAIKSWENSSEARAIWSGKRPISPIRVCDPFVFFSHVSRGSSLRLKKIKPFLRSFLDELNPREHTSS